MQEEKEIKTEKNIDIKETIENFIKTDEPELSQEEAIMQFGEKNTKHKKISEEDDDNANSEEQEHLKRVKKELLASLERVKDLEKKLYGEVQTKEKSQLKVKGAQGKQVQIHKEQEQQIVEQKQQERE